MKKNKIQMVIQSTYKALWEILALYEPTDAYNKMPKGSGDFMGRRYAFNEPDRDDIWVYMGERILKVRKEVSCLSLGNRELEERLSKIIDETECFVRKYEVPGVVKRWKKINPQIEYFDCTFDIRESLVNSGKYEKLLSKTMPKEKYLEMADARRKYFRKIKKKNGKENLRYSDERIFQNELIHTLTLVFEHDFQEYL